jgi:two-component system phosphate regulon sensor histidine kinase PhoR
MLGAASASVVVLRVASRRAQRRVMELQLEQERSIERVDRAGAEMREHSAAVLVAMPDAVIVLRRDGSVDDLNPAAARLLGRPAGRARGQRLPDLLRSSELSAMVEALREGEPSSAGDALGSEIEVPGPPRRILRVRASRLPSGGVVVVLLDVTELRRLETVRRDFVANVSHELRTPVSVILGNVEALRDGALAEPETARRFVDALHRNAQRLSLLVSDLLDLSRIEAGHAGRAPEELELAALLRSTVEPFVLRAESRRQVLRLSVPEDLHARADRAALEQVLANLLDNALKYTPEGGCVELLAGPVEAAGAAPRVRIEVSDDGPGIPDIHKSRIFERFFRIDPGRSRALGGTGLGLAIVRHLTEAMGGNVRVEPNSPRGSRFVVELPAGSTDSSDRGDP